MSAASEAAAFDSLVGDLACAAGLADPEWEARPAGGWGCEWTSLLALAVSAPPRVIDGPPRPDEFLRAARRSGPWAAARRAALDAGAVEHLTPVNDKGERVWVRVRDLITAAGGCPWIAALSIPAAASGERRIRWGAYLAGRIFVAASGFGIRPAPVADWAASLAVTPGPSALGWLAGTGPSGG